MLTALILVSIIAYCLVGYIFQDKTYISCCERHKNIPSRLFFLVFWIIILIVGLMVASVEYLLDKRDQRCKKKKQEEARQAAARGGLSPH